MFDALSAKLQSVFKNLSGRGVLSEKDIDTALREIRLALLEADVGLDIVKKLLAKIRRRAVGQEVIASVSPGRQVLKIVYEQIIELLGSGTQELRIASPPATIMLVGLQGSGKTTSAVKLARRLRKERNLSILLASLDVYRPAAMEQLQMLADRAEIACLPVIQGQQPLDIARRAGQAARLAAHDLLILDTAGRSSPDAQMMAEAVNIAKLSSPAEIILVADAMAGQDAVQTARHFSKELKLTGLLMTRADADSRGGACLSMLAETGIAIKFVGTGENIDDLEPFDPERMARRILGQGDMTALLEKATKMQDLRADDPASGKFDLDEMARQLKAMIDMGGAQGLAGMLPGAGGKLPAGMDDQTLTRQIAAISSMTPTERKKPAILNASRKKRIAKGAGIEVSQINRLLKMHRSMADMMRKIGTSGGLKPGGLKPGGLGNLAALGKMRGLGNKLDPGLLAGMIGGKKRF